MGPHRQIEKAAAAWLVRRDREEWNNVDQAEFQAWLSASTAHRLAFIRLQAAWQQAGRLKVLAAGLPNGGALFPADQLGMPKPAKSAAHLSRHEDWERSGAREPRRFRMSARRALGVSVAAACLAAAVVGWIAWPRQETSYRTAIEIGRAHV